MGLVAAFALDFADSSEVVARRTRGSITEPLSPFGLFFGWTIVVGEIGSERRTGDSARIDTVLT